MVERKQTIIERDVVVTLNKTEWFRLNPMQMLDKLIELIQDQSWGNNDKDWKILVPKWFMKALTRQLADTYRFLGSPAANLTGVVEYNRFTIDNGYETNKLVAFHPDCVYGGDHLKIEIVIK